MVRRQGVVAAPVHGKAAARLVPGEACRLPFSERFADDADNVILQLLGVVPGVFGLWIILVGFRQRCRAQRRSAVRVGGVHDEVGLRQFELLLRPLRHRMTHRLRHTDEIERDKNELVALLILQGERLGKQVLNLPHGRRFARGVAGHEQHLLRRHIGDGDTGFPVCRNLRSDRFRRRWSRQRRGAWRCGESGGGG